MKKITIECDACRAVVLRPDGEVTQPFVGFELRRLDQSLQIVDPGAAQRHVCQPCLSQFAALFSVARDGGFTTEWPAGGGR